jgi:hypothetical protein
VGVRATLPDGWACPDLDASGPFPYRWLRFFRGAAIAKLHDACDRPEAAQAEALARVLDAAAGTPFARAHGLDRVRTLDEYRSAVPIRPWAGFADDLRRTAAGEAVLVRHPVRSFVKTSGTTGEPKLLPVTDVWAAEVAEAQLLWVMAMVREQPECAQGKVLATVGKAVEGRTPSGLAYGANTGRMAAAQPLVVRLRYAVPPEVHDIEDAELRHYVLLRIALAADVRTWTTANPSTILALCRAMARHREALSADLTDATLCRGPAEALDRGLRRRLWPWLWRRRPPADFRPLSFWKLAAVNCWKGGAAPFFLDRLPEALGGPVRIREAGISASEGYFAIPLHSSWGGGVAWAAGHLLELVPVGGSGAIALHEAELGKEYRLIVSTTAGLYRYDLDDVVRVVGRWRNAPVMVFVGKGRDVLSVTGEKVTAEQAAAAVRSALSGPAVGFSVSVRMAEQPAYVVYVEGAPIEGLAARFDAALRALNNEYDGKRGSDRLAHPVAEVLPDGTYARWRATQVARGAADGQIKDPIVVQPADISRLTR